MVDLTRSCDGCGYSIGGAKKNDEPLFTIILTNLELIYD
jgi:hypothetical protein